MVKKKFFDKKLGGFLFVCALLFSLYNCGIGSKMRRNLSYTPALILPFKGKSVAPKMVRVEGGAVVMGGYVDSWLSGNEPRVVTINSFEISKDLITNREYAIYLDDLMQCGRIKDYKAALPKESSWNRELRWNDNLKDYPFARVFLDYPAMVTYHQAVKYCEWLTLKEIELNKKSNPVKVKTPVKESKKIELEEGAINDASESDKKSDLVTEDSIDKNDLREMAEFHSSVVDKAQGERLVTYRLPTEAELEYAAKGSIITQNEEGVETTNIVRYGNTTSTVRYTEGKYKGEFIGLFKTARGNYKGIPGSANTGAPTEPVNERAENGVGVRAYGNLWRWTRDIYSHTPAYVYEDYAPCRQTQEKNSNYDSRSPLSKPCRVIFGGSFEDSPEFLRSFAPEDTEYGIGFHVVCSAE